MKNEEKEKRQINKESQITTINIFGFFFYIKNYILLENIVWKNSLYHHISFTVFVSWRDIWNAIMIHQSSYGFTLLFRPHDLRPEIYINGLGTTMQISKAMDYLTLISVKHLHFRERQKHVTRKFLLHPVEECASQRYKEKLERNWNNSVCIKVHNFLKSANF